mmetsp:Transcript_38629/g.43894  ORF Transcript_38629/g.43894 Transcript_38629/m.43894 type:complete len:93 (+) Transcript_38629:1489-1767(+)
MILSECEKNKPDDTDIYPFFIVGCFSFSLFVEISPSVNRLVLDRKRKDTRRRRRKIEHEERKKERMKDFDASKGRWKLARKHKSTTAKQKTL